VHLFLNRHRDRALAGRAHRRHEEQRLAKRARVVPAQRGRHVGDPEARRRQAVAEDKLREQADERPAWHGARPHAQVGDGGTYYVRGSGAVRLSFQKIN
jgi:hypothetical protein